MCLKQQKQIFLFLLILCTNVNTICYSQISLSDFTEPIVAYNNNFVDTSYQYFDEIKSNAKLEQKIKSIFKYKTTDFPKSYSKIIINKLPVQLNNISYNSTISWSNDSGYYKPCSLEFKLNNDSSNVYYYLNKSNIDSTTAFLILPGSGVNQGTPVANYDTTNYHNSVCNIAKKCNNYGDVFTFVRPADDFTALWINNGSNIQKINYNSLTYYTNMYNINWAANCMIQITALTKYLKSKYKKVVVLGLSSGAWGATYSSLESEPDATNAASGFSILFHGLIWQNNPSQFYYDGLFADFPLDSIKKTIERQKTEYLFSYGSNDGVTYMATENTQYTTQNFLNSPISLPNTAFFYNFSTHRFPCETLDSFFTKIKNKPKPFVKVIDTLCNADSVLCAINFMGTPPFSFDLYKDSTYFNSYTSNTNSLTISIFQNGIYQIKNLEDAGSEPGFKSDFFTIKKNNKINFSLLSKLFDCDSLKTKITLKLNGTPPWTLNYNFNASNFIVVTNDSLKKIYFPNGNLIFNSIIDSNLCFKTINTPLNLNEVAVGINFSIPQYICDSSKTAITLLLSGKKPWKIIYKKNSIPYTIITSSPNYTVFLSNGSYLFENISDSNNCSKIINQIFNFNYQPLSYTITNPIYNCDSNKAKINFTLIGNPPFTVYYRKNNASQSFSTSQLSVDKYFNNGYYIFDSIKDATCSKNISPAIQHYFSYNSINFFATSPLYNCDSNKAKINFTLLGNPPYTIYYSQNGVANQFVTSQNTIDKYYSNGIYNFSKIADATQCNLNFNVLKNINYNLLGCQMSNPIYNCDSNKSKIHFEFQGSSPWTIYYKKNNIPFSLTSTNSSMDAFFNNGNYSFDSVKDATCLKIISPSVQHSFNYTPTNTSISTPFYNCDSNKTFVQFTCQGNSPYTVYYTQNGILNQFTTGSGYTNKAFNNGIYYFIQSVDSLNCNAPINQIQNINYQPINYTFADLGFNCDSNKTKLNITLSGNSPWTIFYRRNNIPQSISTSNTTNNFYFLNGFYEFDSIKDATCTKPINPSIHYFFNYSPISVSTQNPIYDCDSNKAFVQFNMTGNPPYTLNYTKDGINNNMITTSNYFNQSFQNGFYYFIKVTDNTNCQTPINQLNHILFDTLNYRIDSPTFICDSVKTKFQFHFQGNAPWTVFYRKNNSPNSFTTSDPDYSFLTTNSTFNFDSLKDATCSKVMNPALDYTINNSLLNVIMDTPMFDCNVNKVKVHFQLQGNAPWQIHYFKIGVPTIYNTFTTYANNYDAYFTTGNYIIDSITDNSNCTKVYNTYVDNSFSPVGCVKTATIYNCDSNKTQINYQLLGDAPWTISYLNIDSNTIHQEYTSANNFNLFLNNGNYVIQSLTDYKCTKLINDTLHLNVPKLISTISAEAVSCDSNKMYVIINATSGNPPYYYKYYKNNILQTKTSYFPTDTFYLENGAYFFERMSDSIGCEIIFNKNVVVEYNPFFLNNITNKYNCEKDSTLVSFDISNYDDVYLQYTKNNSPVSSLNIDYNMQDFYFSNGTYHWINIMDSIGCIKSIDQYLEINNEPIQINKDSLIKDCENREYTYQFSFDGKSPWKVNYNKNNIFQTETLFNENNNWTIPAGKYYFINVTDSNLCSMDILRQDTLIQFLNQNPIIEYTNNRITATQNPFNYTWYKDNLIIPNEKSNVINPYGNGVYAASTLDSAGCIYYSNKITLNFPEDINLYPNPSSDQVNITVNANYGDYWEYTLYDMFGNQIAHEQVSFPYKEINIEHLAKGVYHFVIEFSVGFNADKKVIRFMKN